jgi:hypothetical protein
MLFISSGLYYKHVTIVNDASSGVKKLKASLNDAARVIIYDHHMFIVQATALYFSSLVYHQWPAL